MARMCGDRMSNCGSYGKQSGLQRSIHSVELSVDTRMTHIDAFKGHEAFPLALHILDDQTRELRVLERTVEFLSYQIQYGLAVVVELGGWLQGKTAPAHIVVQKLIGEITQSDDVREQRAHYCFVRVVRHLEVVYAEYGAHPLRDVLPAELREYFLRAQPVFIPTLVKVLRDGAGPDHFG